MKEIVDYLDLLFPNPKCELNYTKDYELLIATMLSTQTTDKRVNMVTDVLFKKYPTLELLRLANVNDLIDIIKPLGNYTRKANNIILIANSLKTVNDKVPNDRMFIEGLSGVGRKTANVVLSTIYDEAVIAVDTHVERVAKRLGITDSDDVLVTEKKLYSFFKNVNYNRLHHQLLLFGRYYCKSKKPLCENCQLKNICKKTSV